MADATFRKVDTSAKLKARLRKMSSDMAVFCYSCVHDTASEVGECLDPECSLAKYYVERRRGGKATKRYRDKRKGRKK